ncbi:hypothetical protein [Streptomyces lunaelactis]|uniref:hypothetical protein n=1 Tax=Streptomyces lunaelactis TaxID=1535768 RepID=UPI00131F4249|nr:hypothetical protein [Streptomyces lunaelactis]NUK27805.1 hypothetical protein [Streptomyces lunaelactis]NUK88345.1 hypothetical protein [Streptomyces lunaelactis]
MAQVLLHGRVPAWLVTRAADVERALLDPRLSSSDHWLSAAPDRREAGRSSIKISLMGLDGADHQRLRPVLARPFGPHRIEALSPPIQVLADNLVGHIAARLERGEIVDLVQSLALPLPLPLHAMCDILGIPPDDRKQVHQLTHHLLAPGTAPNAREDTRQQLRSRISIQIGRLAAPDLLPET